MRLYVCSLLLVLTLEGIVCPPVTPKPTPKPQEEGRASSMEDQDFGLEYERYLKEVVSVLESDETFKKKLEETNASDIRTDKLLYHKYLQEVMEQLAEEPAFLQKLMQFANNSDDLGKKSGEIANHLEFVSHGIRSKLDELKRKEIDRLRQAMKMQHQLERGMPFGQALPINPAGIVEGFKKMGREINLPPVDKERVLGHLDHHNPNSFEVEDLAKLIKRATSDLEELDKKRKEEFKHYELEKERERRVKLKGMNDVERAAEQKAHDEEVKKHADHPKLHHPGSKDQLEEVWENGDGMAKEDFDPKTFFYMHDTNGDGVLDEQEVEALFNVELDKVYDKDNPEDDPVERDEEMNRMREHVFGEIDKDGNKLIDLSEFMQNAQADKFNKDEGWDTLDEEPNYSDDEIEQYMKDFDENHPDDQDEDDNDHQVHPDDHHDKLQGKDQGQPAVQHMDQKVAPPAAAQEEHKPAGEVQHPAPGGGGQVVQDQQQQHPPAAQQQQQVHDQQQHVNPPAAQQQQEQVIHEEPLQQVVHEQQQAQVVHEQQQQQQQKVVHDQQQQIHDQQQPKQVDTLAAQQQVIQN